jgi:hypothetical protein
MVSGRGRGPRAPKSGRLKGWGDGDSIEGEDAVEAAEAYEEQLRDEEEKDRARMDMEDAEQRRFQKEKEVCPSPHLGFGKPPSRSQTQGVSKIGS